ncbi:glutamate-rich protein 6B [Anas acuta]|uniref:glutamate-rich protein 6B n=1 Tax=Anas acuta TaxID=28680 RepID=UPI0035C8AA0C
MSNGRKLSRSGSNQSPPKIFPPGTVSSDSSSALTVENVKRLEKQYATSKEAFNNKKIQDYIKQSNLALSSKEKSRKTSTDLVWKEEPEGASSSFPEKLRENNNNVCWKTSAVISKKGKLLTAPATDSPSARLTGCKPRESNDHSRRHEVEDEMTQTEWSYSDEPLAAGEDAVSVIGGESSGAVSGRSSPKSTEDAGSGFYTFLDQFGEYGIRTPHGTPWKSQRRCVLTLWEFLLFPPDVVVLLRDTEVFSEAEDSEEPAETEEEAGAEEGEEDNQAEMGEQAVCEPLELAQGSPRAESEEEPLSGGEEHEDDGTAALLLTDEETAVTEEPPARCTFCSTPEKPIPTVADLKEQPQEKLFCCWSYRKVFDTVIQDLVSEDEAEEEMEAAPHTNPSQDELRSSIKEKLLQQLDEGGFGSYRELLQQYLRFVACTRISFRLSKPSEYTVRPKTSERHCPTSAPPEDLFELDSDCVVEHLKLCRSPGPVRRCYSDGQTFFLLFPDGSGQVYYPSGNVAVLITFTEEARFTYLVLEDSRCLGVRAAFGSRGHGVCFHPDGQSWIILTPRTGICFDQAGGSQKHWSWHDLSRHVHGPPFQPITATLNGHLTLKIVSQDQIHLWFTSHSHCIRFNVGARLKLKDPRTSHLLKGLESEEELFLQSKKTQLRSLLAKIEAILQ